MIACTLRKKQASRAPRDSDSTTSSARQPLCSATSSPPGTRPTCAHCGPSAGQKHSSKVRGPSVRPGLPPSRRITSSTSRPTTAVKQYASSVSTHQYPAMLRSSACEYRHRVQNLVRDVDQPGLIAVWRLGQQRPQQRPYRYHVGPERAVQEHQWAAVALGPVEGLGGGLEHLLHGAGPAGR